MSQRLSLTSLKQCDTHQSAHTRGELEGLNGESMLAHSDYSEAIQAIN